MLEQIKSYKKQGKFELIKKEMLKVLETTPLPVRNNEIDSIVDTAPTKVEISPLPGIDPNKQQTDSVTKEPLSEEEKTLNDISKINTIENFIEESFLNTLNKEIISTINNSPELLKES